MIIIEALMSYFEELVNNYFFTRRETSAKRPKPKTATVVGSGTATDEKLATSCV
jgi:hypothetical protein